MKKQAVILLLLMMQTLLFGQTAEPSFTLTLSDDEECELIAYLPQQPNGQAVVCCPGGGYSHLAIDHEGHQWAPFFNNQGIAFFILKYRMPHGDRSIPITDAEEALRTVRKNATQWHIAPDKVGIMGFSAGGHLAATISTHSSGEAKPDFSILFYPVISMQESESHKGSCQNFLGEQGQADEALVESFSAHKSVKDDLTPPAIIITANDDSAVPPLTNSIAYYIAMHRHHRSCSLLVYPTGGHGFGYRSTFAYHKQMLSELSQWLQTVR